MKLLVVCIFFLACAILSARADCYDDVLHVSWRDLLKTYGEFCADGRIQKYCKTKGIKPTVLTPGQTRETQDCYQCTCDTSGLHCCGFGIKAGTNAQHVNTPPGCSLVIDGCNYYFLNTVTGYYCL